jgi:hypothetical protein
MEMKRKRPTEDAADRTASAWQILAAVAIQAMQMMEYIEYADHEWWDTKLVRMSHVLNDQLEMQAVLAVECEHMLKSTWIDVPEHFAVTTASNPYFNATMETPPDNSNGASHDLGDELPF